MTITTRIMIILKVVYIFLYLFRILVDTGIRPGNLCIGRISQWRMRRPQVFTSGDRHFGANTTSSWVRHWQFPWLSNRSHAIKNSKWHILQRQPGQKLCCFWFLITWPFDWCFFPDHWVPVPWAKTWGSSHGLRQKQLHGNHRMRRNTFTCSHQVKQVCTIPS